MRLIVLFLLTTDLSVVLTFVACYVMFSWFKENYWDTLDYTRTGIKFSSCYFFGEL